MHFVAGGSASGGRHFDDTFGPSTLRTPGRGGTAAGGRAEAGNTAGREANSFTTHLPTEGYDIRTVQYLLGHTDISF